MSEQQDPQSLTTADDEQALAFELLRKSVGTLRGDMLRWPTASEVRLHLKQATYNGFDPKRLGYKRFRDFLADAEQRGFISLDDSHPGDIAVGGADEQAGGSSEPAIRRDLWKAVTDWSPDLEHYFDLEGDRVVTLPREARPLEPFRIHDLREEVAQSPSRYLRIPSLPWNKQSALMWEFAGSSAPKQDIRQVLVAALQQDKPSRSWQAVLRVDPAANEAWRRFMRSRVEQHLEAWRSATPAARGIQIFRRAESQPTSEGPETRPEATHQADISELLRVLATSLDRGPGGPTHRRESHGAKQSLPAESLTDRQLRLLVASAVERMPIEEVRRLAIPLGYLFPE